MGKDKRKYFRSKCLFPAKIEGSKGSKGLIKRVSVRDFSSEGLKIVINFNLDPSSILKTKVYLPEKEETTSMSGEIVWSKYEEGGFEVGLKIKDMDEKAKFEMLDLIFPRWLECTG